MIVAIVIGAFGYISDAVATILDGPREASLAIEGSLLLEEGVERSYLIPIAERDLYMCLGERALASDQGWKVRSLRLSNSDNLADQRVGLGSCPMECVADMYLRRVKGGELYANPP